MTARPDFSAFSETEHRDRLARARKALAEANFDGCIVVAPENLFYLAGYDLIGSYVGPQALIFSVKDDKDPALIIRNLDRPLAKETSWIEDVRLYQLNADDVGALITKIAREHGLATGRLGLELHSYAVTAGYAAEIRRALPSASIEDFGLVLSRIQVTSNLRPRSRMCAKRPATPTSRVEAARKALRTGIKETAFCGAVEGAMRQAGSDYPAIPTECGSGPRSSGGHATAMPKIIGPNELVHVEFAGVARRYHSVSMLTMATGDPGSRRDRSMALRWSRCKRGLSSASRERAWLISKRFFVPHHQGESSPCRADAVRHWHRHWLSADMGGSFQIDRFSDGTLQPGMVFYVHSWLSLADYGLGVMLGGTYLVGEKTVEQLSGAGPVELFLA